MDAEDHCSVVGEAQAYCGAYQTFSSPLNLPSHRQDSAQLPATILPLFGAASSSSNRGKENGGAPATEVSTSGQKDHSTVAFCGGPIWALDWCPYQSSSAQYLAVAAHPKARERNVIGRALEGPVLVQIWRVPSSANTDEGARRGSTDSAAAAAGSAGPGPGSGAGGWMPGQGEGPNGDISEAGCSGCHAPDGLPRMVLGICLDGGVVWDCKWRPGSSGGDSRLGTLAVVLGSGEVQLLPVPHPDHIGSAHAAAHQRPGPRGTGTAPPGELGGPRLVRLQPEASAAGNDLGGSLPSVAEWLPSAPHDLLLVGFWDGTVALWRLITAMNGAEASAGRESEREVRMELLLHMPALEGPVRGLAWVPPEVATAAGDRAHRHLFATVGHSDKLRFWDSRSPYSPLLEAPCQTYWKMGVEWTGDPAGVIVAEDGGTLRWIDLNPFGRTSRMSCNTNITGGQGTMWDVHCQPGGGWIAYASADGEVAVVRLERDLASQRHSVLAGFRWEAGLLTVLDRADLAVGSRLRAGSSKQPRVSVPQEAVHRVRWSCAPAQPEAGVAGGILVGDPAGAALTGRGGRMLAGKASPALLACGGAAGLLLIMSA